jgi:hypothetical protein
MQDYGFSDIIKLHRIASHLRSAMGAPSSDEQPIGLSDGLSASWLACKSSKKCQRKHKLVCSNLEGGEACQRCRGGGRGKANPISILKKRAPGKNDRIGVVD